MNRLEKLIAELCPDGVKYLTIPELFITRNGYTPSKANAEFWENGTIPWFRMEDIRENGRILTKSTQYVSEKAIKGKLFPEDSIIIATSATIGEHALIKVPSLANQRFTYLVLKDEFKSSVDMMFIFYYCFKLDEFCKTHLNQGNFASVDMKQFAEFKFPVPPLPVQREIIRILDNFTELTAELTTELTTRRKQYSYYCNQLLKGTTRMYEMIPLSDFSQFTYGYTDKAKDFGTARFIRITDITDNGTLNPDDAKYIDLDNESKKYLLHSGDIVMARTGATYGKTLYIPDDSPAVYASFLIKITLDNNRILNRYYWHFAQSSLYWTQATKLVSTGGQPQFNTGAISRVKVPVPSIEEQASIVSILDRFDALCNDLTSGLPAEIEARKKQYEYYRDKLLTFKEKTS